MAFDMGFDFRATAGFVTDPAYGVPCLREAYPHTYTNGNGNSINAGYGTVPTTDADRSNTNDARIAGVNIALNTPDFKVDLSSGSAPGAGTYTVDCAIGDASSAQTQTFQVLDTSTVLIDGSGGIATGSGQFVDATLAVVTASTNWTGATASKTFATTLAVLKFGLSTTTTVAHFRLTLQSAVASFGNMGLLTLMGVGA